LGIAADFVLIVVAGLLGGILARLCRLPLLVGYVAAGIAVGPHTGGPTVGQLHDIETLAEIGVALLLFSLGLEVSFRDLQIVKRVSLIGGPIQILVTLAAGAAAGIYGLGMTSSEAMWFGAMVAVSSTMVVLKVLAAAGVTNTLASKVMVGLLLVQDLAVIPMLVILPQLGNPEGLVMRVAQALAIAAAILVAVFVGGTRLLPPVFRRILSWGSRELFLVAVVATGVGLGAAMQAAGFSFALGAFVAGLILSESEFSHQALSDVVPLRDIFGLLFFVTVGMLFDPMFAMENMGMIAIVVIAIMLGKALIFGGIARAFGYRFMAPWIVGLGLCQIGEFSFVLARTGFNADLISKSVYDLALTVTVITMALSPVISVAALPLGRAWQTWRGAPEVPPRPTVSDSAHSDHVIVAGYGRTGRAAARALRQAQIPCLIVEDNYSLLADLTADGFVGIWGDIAQEEILLAARIHDAQMLLLTMPDQNTVNLAVDRCRRMRPDLVLVARSTNIHYVHHLRELGVAAVQPEFEGGLEMVRLGLLRYGQSAEDTSRIVDILRREIYEVSE